jgi:membrane fusion protein (multidrug efflux system)
MIGLSAYAKVDTHNRQGAMLQKQARSKPLMSTDVYQREVHDADDQAERVILANTVATP